MSEGRLSRTRTNRLVPQIVARFWKNVDMVASEMLIDGWAPFTEPVSTQSLVERYYQLLALRDSGDPQFWANTPQAIANKAQFSQLAQRFGPPAPVQQPFGVAPNVSPSAELAASQAAQKLGVQ